MKKILFAISIMLVFLVSCEPQKSQPTQYEDGTVIYQHKFKGEDGHTYIEFRRHMGEVIYAGEDNYTGYVHDPECLKKDMEETFRKVLNEKH